MKKILLFSILIIFCANLPAYTARGNYDEKEIKAIENCRYLGTSACYEELFEIVDDNWIRLNYAIALFNEKELDKAEEELNEIIENYKEPKLPTARYINTSNYNIKENAVYLLSKIKERKEEIKDAYYEDTGDYISDLDNIARWENPNNIKVYIQGETGLEYLFENGFNVWKNGLSGLYFNYVQNINEADIICSFLDYYLDDKVGLTEYKGGIKVINNINYLKAPVHITISRKTYSNREMTNNELLSIIIHEIGHALGIQGHSNSQNDIMYLNTETYQNTTLSERDTNTLYEIYK